MFISSCTIVIRLGYVGINKFRQSGIFGFRDKGIQEFKDFRKYNIGISGFRDSKILSYRDFGISRFRKFRDFVIWFLDIIVFKDSGARRFMHLEFVDLRI